MNEIVYFVDFSQLLFPDTLAIFTKRSAYGGASKVRSYALTQSHLLILTKVDLPIATAEYQIFQ